MSAEKFIVREHTSPAQHIRELPNALAIDEGTPDATLHVSVKQYIPKNNLEPKVGDVTIIAFHANGYNKEVYEPLWDDLLDSLPNDVNIRGIWMADMAQHGASYTLNERKLADGISWDDHARDVLHLVNVHRDQISPPVLGIGHSMGAAQLSHLCRLHPRLFHAVALLDPWFSIMCHAQTPDQLWKRSAARRKAFKSIEDARVSYQKIPLYKTWDQRCFDSFIHTAFRQLPTMLDDQDPGITATTPAVMTFHTNRRVTFKPVDMDPETASRVDKLVYPDLTYNLTIDWPYCMPQATDSAQFLPNLRPRALFLYGNKGSVIRPEWRRSILKTTGTASGGSGGARIGCAEDDLVTGSHFFPFENPKGTAERLAVWLAKERSTWRVEKSILDKRYEHGTSAEYRQRFPPDFSEIARTWNNKSSSKL